MAPQNDNFKNTNSNKKQRCVTTPNSSPKSSVCVCVCFFLFSVVCLPDNINDAVPKIYKLRRKATESKSGWKKQKQRMRYLGIALIDYLLSCCSLRAKKQEIKKRGKRNSQGKVVFLVLFLVCGWGVNPPPPKKKNTTNKIERGGFIVNLAWPETFSKTNDNQWFF